MDIFQENSGGLYLIIVDRNCGLIGYSGIVGGNCGLIGIGTGIGVPVLEVCWVWDRSCFY